jgi:hypothetical protein
MLDSPRDIASVGIHDTAKAVSATRGYIAPVGLHEVTARSTSPLTAISLSLVDLRLQLMVPCICAPNMKKACTTNGTDRLRTWAKCKPIQELILTCKHFALAFSG